MQNTAWKKDYEDEPLTKNGQMFIIGVEGASAIKLKQSIATLKPGNHSFRTISKIRNSYSHLRMPKPQITEGHLCLFPSTKKEGA